MEKKGIKLDTIKKTDPFKVPERYFENFVPDLMAKLPEHPVEQPKVISLWDRVKPFVYMAAMFAGIALVVNLFTGELNNRQKIAKNYASESLKLNSPNDIEDFYHYYEDKMVKEVYDDKLADFQEETNLP
ncbi:hypothetical protein FACS1894145_3240 [Bacteroidia bacterium]|nr:hypothetical protein FACS1894145_3240 [Bacteroidia bacterium]